MTALRSFASQICVFLLVSQVLTQTISIGTNVVTSTAVSRLQEYARAYHVARH